MVIIHDNSDYDGDDVATKTTTTATTMEDV